MQKLKSLCLALLIAFAAPIVATAEPLPEPVHGVTFEEWASANGRLANKTDTKDVLETLKIDEAAFGEVNEKFLQVLKDGDPMGDVYRVYGEAFGDPNRGRFANAGHVGTEDKLATFDDYARLEGHMAAAPDIGMTPQQVLDAHNLTPYEYSQEAGKWIGKLVAETKQNGSDSTAYWHETIAKYKAEYIQNGPKP